MIISPEEAFRWLSYANRENIQQSGIDVTLKSLSQIEGGMLGRTSRNVIGAPIAATDNWFELSCGEYDFVCNEYVSVPDNCCAIIMQRSSLNRLGLYITTGLYDNGFHNYVGGVLHVPHLKFGVKIEQGARIAQIIFIRSEGRSAYKGQYNG